MKVERYACVMLLILSFLSTIILISIQREWQLLQNEVTPESHSRLLALQMGSSIPYRNATYGGSIIIENGTYTIENMDLHLQGNITVRNNATLLTRNARLFFTRDWRTSEKVLMLREKSIWLAYNTTVLFKGSEYYDFQIEADDESQVTLVDSKLSGWAYITMKTESRVFLSNSSLIGLGSRFTWAAIQTEGNSMARIENSTIDSMSTQGNSSTRITKSKVTGNISTWGNSSLEIEDSELASIDGSCENSTIHLSKSTILYLDSAGAEMNVEDSTIQTLSAWRTTWVKGSSVISVEANGNSCVWLISSSSKSIITRDQGRVYIGWQVPILGVVAIPHSWIPILGFMLLFGIIIGTIASTIIVKRKWEQRKEKSLDQ